MAKSAGFENQNMADESRLERGEDLHLYKKSINLQIIDILLPL